MGELSAFNSSPSPPPWAFYAAPDLSQWRWEPPQHPSALRHHQSHVKTKDAGLSAILPRWLGDWVADPPDKALPELPDLDPPLSVRKSFTAELNDFRQSAANAPLHVLKSDTETLCQNLQQSVIIGECDLKTYKNTCRDILASLDSRFGSRPPSSAGDLYMSLCSAIVKGFGSSQVFHPNVLNTAFWNKLLARVSLLPVQDIYHLYSEVLDRFPRDGHALNRWTLFILGRYLFGAFCGKVAGASTSSASVDRTALSLLQGQPTPDPSRLACGSEITRIPSAPAQSNQLATAQLQNTGSRLASAATHASATLGDAEIMSRALATIQDDKFGHALVFHMNKLVQKQLHLLVASTARSELRDTWLSVLAHMPAVREGLLLESVAFLSSKSLGMEALTGPELCTLMIAQWASRGYLDSPDTVRELYEKYCSGHDEAAMASLALAIFAQVSGSASSTWARRGLYHSFWRILASLGRLDDMVRSLKALSHTITLPRGFLFALCSPCENHRVILRLANLYMHDLRGPGDPDWNPALVRKHAKKIILDPYLPPALIWPALGIDWMGQRLGTTLPEKRWRHLGSYGRHRVAITKKLATTLASAPHLRPRVAFRHVSQCVRFMELVTRDVPIPVMKALYRVVMKSTSREEMGVAARQVWFIDLVRRHYGNDAADECGRALQEWREGMQRVWTRRVRARYG